MICLRSIPIINLRKRLARPGLLATIAKIANGPLTGQTLAQLSEKYERELVGDAARDARRFPLLLKFLFPHEKLSVQVHPDDEQARRVNQPWGKTECWYVAHAKPGAQIALGLKPGVTVAQLEQAIQDKRAEDLLNWLNVYTGDMIYVAGGTVHTLGPGSVIIETQQQSDTTYRLYDYGRPRELHLKEGLAAVKPQVASGKVVRAAPAANCRRRQPAGVISGGALFCCGYVRDKESAGIEHVRRIGQEFCPNSSGGGRLWHSGSGRIGTGYADQRRCRGDSSSDWEIQRPTTVGAGISESSGTRGPAART